MTADARRLNTGAMNVATRVYRILLIMQGWRALVGR